MSTSAVPWQRQQTLRTRDHIIDTGKRLLLESPSEPFTHERIALAGGLGARTVYRHFPTRVDLMQALWERVRDDTKTRFPATEDEVIAFARAQFAEFNEREGLVRASNAFSAGNELRARGSLEGRPAFGRSLAGITAHLPALQQRLLIAICLAIYSAPFWQLLRDRGELAGAEPGEAAAWALAAVLKAAKADARLARAGRTRVQPKHREESRHGQRRRRRAQR